MSSLRVRELKMNTAVRLIKESINECEIELKKYPYFKCIFNSENRKERNEIKKIIKEAKQQLK